MNIIKPSELKSVLQSKQSSKVYELIHECMQLGSTFTSGDVCRSFCKVESGWVEIPYTDLCDNFGITDVVKH